MVNLDDERSSAPSSPYRCYLSVQTARVCQGLTLLPSAPSAPVLPPFLEDAALTATLSPDGKSLSLRLSSAAIDCAVQVWTPRRALLPSASVPASRRMEVLAVPGLLGPAGVDLGDEYAASVGVPAAGMKIALRLVPLSVAGFRGQPVTVTAIVTQSAGAPGPHPFPMQRDVAPHPALRTTPGGPHPALRATLSRAARARVKRDSSPTLARETGEGRPSEGGVRASCPPSAGGVRASCRPSAPGTPRAP